MTHPLTDDLLEKKFDPLWDYDEDEWTYSSESMRNAADWQLEQVIKWLKATKSTVKLCPSVLAVQIEQAMRPQEES